MLDAEYDALPPDRPATMVMTTTVHDRYGEPLVGQTVGLAVEEDSEPALINGGAVYTGTTDAEGQLVVTFERIAMGGEASVVARVPTPESSGAPPADRVEIDLGPLPTLYLPLVRH